MKKITLFMAALAFSFYAMADGMSGTYKVGTGETDPNFTSLKAACDALNTNGVAGDVLFEITSDLTENDDIWLGVNTNSYQVTIKPAAGVTAKITFTKTSNSSSSGSIDGCFAIGSPTGVNTNLIPTKNIIIDGSNAVNGTTKDLTLEGPSTSTQKSVIRIFGDNDNITIKNCIITNNSTSGNSTAPINVTNYNASSTNYTPDNLIIDNNTLNSTAGNGGLGVYLSNSGTPTVGMTGITVSNNIISHRGTRGVMCNYVNDANIFGNSISANMQLGSGAGAGIWLSTGTSAAGTFNIYNNRFSSLRFLNNTAGASNGYIAIDNQFASPKIVNIYNNFITGFVTTAAVSNSKIYGIRHTGSSTSNVYHNTIVIPEMTDMSTFGSSYIAGIAFATAATNEASPTGTINIKNNILVSNETGTTMKVWGIRRVGTNGTFNSDYNDIYANSSNNYVGYYNNADAASLSDWQTASSQDIHSKLVAVNFVDAANGDLRLTGTSDGDANLGVPRLAAVTTDMFGTPRPSITYAGAHEATPLVTKTFTVTVPNGTQHVYIAGSFIGKLWDIGDPFELTATANPNEFTGTFPCEDDVEYKYLCEKGDWDYQEAVYQGSGDPIPPDNHTYAANDVVDIWYRVKSVTLNVSFEESVGVPNQLFILSSINNWADPIELTKQDGTFTTTLTNADQKVPANTKYKYFTNEPNPAERNWECNLDMTASSDRWTIAPVMNDVIQRFTTRLVTETEVPALAPRLMRTPTGIRVELNEPAAIELYNINGSLIEKTKATGTYTRDLNNGIYIIRINGKSTKFVK